MSASLFVIQGRDQGKRFELPDDVCQLGRETDNNIQVHDTEVSRQHAEIVREGDGYAVIDLASSNGTYVNGKQVDHFTLRSGDRIQLGRTMLLFTATGNAADDDLSDVIEFVAREGGSQIVKSIGAEENSAPFHGGAHADSPWLARARSNLQVMYRTALAVSHTLDIDELLQRILDLIFEWVESDRGCIMLLDQENGELHPAARRMRQGLNPDEKIVISRTILDYVLENKEGVLTSDARQDDRWDQAASIVKLGVREAICVPMQGRYGIVGVVYIDTYTPPGRMVQRNAAKFSEEHLKLMVAIGHQAALAVEDTSYYSAMVQSERLAAVGQTIAMLSHHIKNILQGIRGGSYLIEEGLRGLEGREEAEIVRKGWGIVDKNQERISALVLDMLTFSKEREPEFVEASLEAVMSDVVELLAVRAAESGVDLQWRSTPNAPLLSFDPDAMHRAILNIVTNAIDACENTENARVEVRASYGEGQVDVAITDNGPGIPAAEIKKVFTLFESGKGARGTGLGLTVSQKILREHGGDILVESEVGAGSRFILRFPAADFHKTPSVGSPPTKPFLPPADDTGATH